MKVNEEPMAAYPRLVRVCAAAAGLIGLLILASWAMDAWRIGTFGDEFVPMAPGTACLVVVFAAALFLRGRRRARPAIMWIAVVVALGAFAMSLMAWTRGFLGFELAVEQWLAPTSEQIMGIPVGRTSPLTASAFLCAALTLLLELSPFRRGRPLRQMTSLLVLIPLLIGLVVVLDYAVGAPLFFADWIVPMPLLTALSLLLLSIALLVSAGPDTWLLRLLSTRTPGRSPQPSFQLARGPLSIFLLLCFAIVVAWHLHAKLQMGEARRKIQDDLAAIADSKSLAIAFWYDESLENARILLSAPALHSGAQALLSGSRRRRLKPELLGWMEIFSKLPQYRLAALYDAGGSPLLATPANLNLANAANDQGFRDSLEPNSSVTMDFHRDPAAESEAHRDVHIDAWIPIRLKGSMDGRARGAWLVQIDPYSFFYPLVRSWPMATRTAETLLLRREGNGVLFLNDPRDRQNAALSFMLPVGPGHPPTVEAGAGHEAVMEGIDYRGVPVLAAVRKVTGTPWFVLTKVDQDEIYAPLRERAGSMLLGFLAVVLITGLAVSLNQRRRDDQWLERYLAGERFRAFSSDLLRVLNRHAVGRESLREIMRMLRKFAGVEAVGIRLREGEDFPYFETKGFPDSLVESERYLCARDPAGELIRDAIGNPCLECLCGNVILGLTDPSLPFFTENGSFWTNSMTELLAETAEKDLPARMRKRCSEQGYESVALIPLRVGSETIGLLQLNDKRPGRHSPEMVRFLEEVGSSIGIAVERARLEAGLRQFERRYRGYRGLVEDQT